MIECERQARWSVKGIERMRMQLHTETAAAAIFGWDYRDEEKTGSLGKVFFYQKVQLLPGFA